MEELLLLDACTLPTADRPLRLREFEDLFRRAVVGVDRTDGDVHLHLRGGPELAQRVEELIAREQQCCSFFTFTLISGGGEDLLLSVRVPAAQQAVADGLARRAEELTR